MIWTPMQKAGVIIAALGIYVLLSDDHNHRHADIFKSLNKWEAVEVTPLTSKHSRATRRLGNGKGMPQSSQPINSSGAPGQTGNHQHQKQNDPDQFGWTPELLPDPILDPFHCGIANLTLEVNLTTEQRLLCDPDGIFSEEGKVEIISALYNFSLTFSENENKRWRRRLSQSFGQKVAHWWDGVVDWFTGHNSTNAQANSSQGSNPPYGVGIAAIQKIDLPAVLQQGYYYTYQDQSQMINDAAQIFSHATHQNWWMTASEDCRNDGTHDCPIGAYGTLIFLSVQDRVCFISTGSKTSFLLPWWRLGNVVWSMKPNLMSQEYAKAMIAGIQELTVMLQSGPPSMKSRLQDFLSRFGVVLGFAIITFLFGAWGEFRDRRKRWKYAENRSKMDPVEREKARQLQREFNARSCPICLEPFDEEGVERNEANHGFGVLRRVDSYGVIVRGTDNKPIKLLRCGHIFDVTCWRQWVNSGQGDPCICPVCRQDVGKSKPQHEDRDASRAPDQTAGAPNHGAPSPTTSYTDIPLFGRSRLLALHFSRRNGGLRRNRSQNHGSNDNAADEEAMREPRETDQLLQPLGEENATHHDLLLNSR